MEHLPLSVAARPAILSDLALPAVAVAQDGVFTRAQARREGWTDGRQRRLLRDGIWVPITRNVLRSSVTAVGPWQRARAVWLTGERVASHATAGALYGLVVPEELHGIRRSGRPVGSHHNPLRGEQTQPAEIIDHRMALEEQDVAHLGGLAVTAPLRTLADLLCTLPLLVAVEMATDALRRGLIDGDVLTRVATLIAGRQGAPQARFVIESCWSRPFSVLEWRFQQLVATVPGPWLFNHEVRDRDGVIGVVDALHVPSRTVIELDGQRFHGEKRFQADRSRDQRLVAAGFAVLRFTWTDVDRRGPYVLEVVRRAIHARLRKVG